jgi:hypothetical protein
MVSNTNQENDLSFLEKKDANTLSGKDIFFTVVRNLHWLLLCALICGGIAYYRSDRQDRIYESHAKVRLTSVTRSRLESGISTLENITNRRVAITMNAINDEIIVLRSETPMLEVAKRLDLGTSYSYQTKLVKRQRDLYGESPINVKMLDLNADDNATAVITIEKGFLLRAPDRRVRAGERTSGRYGFHQPGPYFREAHLGAARPVLRQSHHGPSPEPQGGCREIPQQGACQP